ncbi:MAG: hypothetical protein V7606_4488, partial [Burkholderiales bacterium]
SNVDQFLWASANDCFRAPVPKIIGNPIHFLFIRKNTLIQVGRRKRMRFADAKIEGLIIYRRNRYRSRLAICIASRNTSISPI